MKMRRKESKETASRKLLPAGTVAEILGLSRQHVYTMAASGKLPSIKLRGPPGLTRPMWKRLSGSTGGRERRKTRRERVQTERGSEMAKELKGIHSLIGQALAPDFSKEDDLGDALYCHMQYISPLLRTTLIAGDPNSEGNIPDTHELLQLFVDCFEKGLEEFDVCSSGREKTAAKAPVAKIGPRRGKAD
jgi:hypothetical protein